MKINLAKNEKEMVKKLLKKKIKNEKNPVKQAAFLISGVFLFLGPVLYLILNISNANEIIKNSGVFIGVLMLLGLIFVLYFAYIKISSKRKNELLLLKSIIEKIVKAGVITLSK